MLIHLMFLLQFFTFEQYKKLLALTPLSPGLVSLPNKHEAETTTQTCSGGGRRNPLTCQRKESGDQRQECPQQENHSRCKCSC